MDSKLELLERMRAAGVRVTREDYIGLAWGEPLPEWTAELEMELPTHLQDWSKFKISGKKRELVERSAIPRDPPRKLYVHRELINADQLFEWAKAQGFEETVNDPHVTVLYSKKPVRWDEMGTSDEEVVVDPDSGREVKELGDDGAVVLVFTSPELQERHAQMCADGASHDYDEYLAHVTITYAEAPDLENVEPYAGVLIFGPEVFEEIDEDGAPDVDERDFNPDQPRDEDGRWTDAGGGQTDSGGGEGSGEAGRGGARSPSEAQSRATKAAAGHAKLDGLPVKPIKIGDDYYVPGPYGKAKDAADAYMRKAGLQYDPPKQYLKVDKERATRVANEFDKMKHDPDDPRVKASYEALAKETIAQWHAIRDTGFKVEWIKDGQPDPYAATPRLAAMDITQNNHWWGFPTDAGFGSGPEAEAAMHNNPMLKFTDEVVDGRRLMVNDVFRIVHDYYGHFKEGVGFRADGEENAWRSHSAMYSELARGAMTSETRGQNSWVNYGPHGDTNRTASAADTVFAPQKIGLMPEWTWNEGRKMWRSYDESEHPRDEQGRWTDAGGNDAAPSGGGGGISGLPKGATINSRAINLAVKRGAFDIKARPGKTEGRYRLSVSAKKTQGIETFLKRETDEIAELYDPRLAELKTFEKGQQYLEFTVAVAKEGVKTEIEPLEDSNIIYRGMSFEEMQSIKSTGYVQSLGEYNIGKEQEGVTYWGSDVRTAESYANGFAPWQAIPTFERPAFVVAVKRPENAIERPQFAGEVGVPGRISSDDIVAVWRGDVFSHRPGDFELRRLGDTNEYEVGGGSSPRSSVAWTRTDLGGALGSASGGEDKLLLVTERPNPESVERWEAELTRRSDELTEQGLAGNTEDDNIGQMQTALRAYGQEPKENLDDNTAGLNVIYDGDVKLLAAAFTFVGKDKVAFIQNIGAIDPDAKQKLLSQIVNKFEGRPAFASRIEVAEWADAKESIAEYEKAGFKVVSGQPEGAAKVRLYHGAAPDAKPEELPEALHVKNVLSSARDVAEKLNFDPKMISIGAQEAPDAKFTLNGKDYLAAGLAYTTGPNKGRIKLFPTRISDAVVAEGVTAHEVEHIKFMTALDAWRNENEQVMREPGPPPDPNGKYYWQRQGGHNAVMTPDGSLRAPYDEKYPAYTALHEALWKYSITKDFGEADGVSSYSAEYWKGYKENTVSTDSALHETLAEMARLKYETGKFPEHRGYGSTKPSKAVMDENAKRWRDLWRTVERVYRSRIKK